MKKQYNIDELTGTIWYEENGYRVSFTDKDPGNADYQRYLRWLQNPDGDDGETL